MYDLTTKSLSINIYNYLPNISIIDNERIKFMTDIFKFHITTFYGWYKENNNYDIYINNIGAVEYIKFIKNIYKFYIFYSSNIPFIKYNKYMIKIFKKLLKIIYVNIYG